MSYKINEETGNEAWKIRLCFFLGALFLSAGSFGLITAVFSFSYNDFFIAELLNKDVENLETFWPVFMAIIGILFAICSFYFFSLSAFYRRLLFSKKP